MKIVPYLTFDGNAEEALNFYSKALGGEVKFIQRFGESPMPFDEPDKHKIMHATFVFSEASFYGIRFNARPSG